MNQTLIQGKNSRLKIQIKTKHTMWKVESCHADHNSVIENGQSFFELKALLSELVFQLLLLLWKPLHLKSDHNLFNCKEKNSRSSKPWNLLCHVYLKYTNVRGIKYFHFEPFECHFSVQKSDTTCIYYPTALLRVQITLKTSTKNITRSLYSRGPVRQVSCRWPIS